MGSENVPRRSSFKTRVFSFFALGAIASGFGYAGVQTYGALTDSFVAPIILTPDNDLVINNKLKMSEVQVERARAKAEIEAIDLDVNASRIAVQRLEALRDSATSAVKWIDDVNAKQMSAGAAESKALSSQRGLLQDIVNRQSHVVDQSRANMEAGLISRSDYQRERQLFDQAQLALLENARTTVMTEVNRHQTALARQALGNAGSKGTITMPELLVREDQLVHVELEILRLQTAERAKLTERRVVADKLAKIDELEGQLRARPLFRAMDKSLDVAFVPYTQIEGVDRGRPVVDCIWGLFHCKDVGTVAELVPGEVILPDPWGNQARGQYAVLDLKEHESAKAKTLRVRGTGATRAAHATGSAVSVR